MGKKAIIALAIFIVLFISAWWANEINEKRYYIDEPNGDIQPFMVNEREQDERFKPREYIKIKR